MDNKKSIWLQADPDNHAINLAFSADLVDKREIGYNQKVNKRCHDYIFTGIVI